MRVFLAIALVASVVAIQLTAQASELRHGCDFDGDGFADLAVGVQDGDVAGMANTGEVDILYGRPVGLREWGAEVWSRASDGVRGTAEPGDRLGSAVACGDFNGDGKDDLAAGVRGDDISGKADAGSVNILYGGGSGLKKAGDQLWRQGAKGVRNKAEAGDMFGSSLAACDFDGDGFDDLAIGIPGEDLNGVEDAGAVSVLYGSENGLTAEDDDLWQLGHPNLEGNLAEGDSFGGALACGSFDGNRKDDLAVGIAFNSNSKGAVSVIYGTGQGLRAKDSQFWHPGIPGVPGVRQQTGYFGRELTTGDYDGDGFDDLGVASPSYTLPSTQNAGAVHVFYGSASDLTADRSYMWHQNRGSLLGSAEVNARFGSSLTTGDFDGDGFDDMGVGVPYQSVGGLYQPGAAAVIYGSATGLTGQGDQIWHQDVPGVLGASFPSDWFGWDLGVGDFDRDGLDDFAVGAPGEDINAKSAAGSVNVLYGTGAGLTAAGDQLWDQSVFGGVETNQAFGDAFAD